MRNQPIAITNILAAATADGIVSRKAVWIVARSRDTGAEAALGVWSGDEDVNLSVLSGESGILVSRPYYGGGNLLKVGDYARTSDMTVQTVTIDLSHLADVARKIVREYDVRRARVEIHDIIFDPATGRPSAADLAEFTGIVDGSPIKTPKVGGEGSAVLSCVSEVMALLTRTNSEKSSYEAQKLRTEGGEVADELFKYASVVSTWEDIKWGTA